jgi:hypothetical protein
MQGVAICSERIAGNVAIAVNLCWSVRVSLAATAFQNSVIKHRSARSPNKNLRITQSGIFHCKGNHRRHRSNNGCGFDRNVATKMIACKFCGASVAIA